MARIRWNERELERLLKTRDGPAGRLMRASGFRVEARAKQLCPVDTGNLRNSIGTEIGRDEAGLFAEVGTDVNYALAVETGSRPHVIEPKDKEALAWPSAAHPVKKVNHPGAPAQPFLRPALDSLRGE